MISWYCEAVLSGNCLFRGKNQVPTIHLYQDILCFVCLLFKFRLNQCCSFSVPDNFSFFVFSPHIAVHSTETSLKGCSLWLYPKAFFLPACDCWQGWGVYLYLIAVGFRNNLHHFYTTVEPKYPHVVDYLGKLRQTGELWRCVAVYLSVRYSKIQLRNSPFATLLCFKGKYFYGEHCQYVC